MAHDTTHQDIAVHHDASKIPEQDLNLMLSSYYMIVILWTSDRNYISSYVRCRPDSTCELCIIVRAWTLSWIVGASVDMRNIKDSSGTAHTSIRDGDHSVHSCEQSLDLVISRQICVFYLCNIWKQRGENPTDLNWICHDVIMAGFEYVTEWVEFEAQWYLMHALPDSDMEITCSA